jgi:hypothetical protein
MPSFDAKPWNYDVALWLERLLLNVAFSLPISQATTDLRNFSAAGKIASQSFGLQRK